MAADPLIRAAAHPIGGFLLKRAGLPMPVALARGKAVLSPRLQGRVVVVNRAAAGSANSALESALKAIKDPDTAAGAFSKSRKAPTSVVLHALDLSSPAQMAAAFPAWRDTLQMAPANSRVVVVHRSLDDVPAGANAFEHAAAVNGLHGFIASASKELGGKGTTINALRVRGQLQESSSSSSSSAAAALVEPLAFFLSDQCAYVNGQTLEVNVEASVAKDVPAKPLSGKVAVVTGGARGIGAAIVKRFQSEGAHVCVVDLPSLIDRKSDIHALAQDITAADAGAKLVEHVNNHFGRLDIMVHNAGITMDRSLRNLSVEAFARVVQVNLQSIIAMDQALWSAAKLVQPGARWVLMSSINGIAGAFGQTNYSYTKSGVIGYAAAVAKSAPVAGMTINAIAPGFIETDMTNKIPWLARNIGRRMNTLSQGGLPDDIASAAAFFASPGSQGVSGQTLRVCGGAIVGK